MRVTVIGTGYLGAVHAACMAEIGHDVLGVDADPDKIASLASGQALFYEPGLAELLARTIGSGKLRFSTSLAEAADFGDVHFICVGTPQLSDSGAADMSLVEGVIDELAPQLSRDCLVVGKSTVPVGSAARLSARLTGLAHAAPGAKLAWNPEFLSEGTAIQDTLRPDRVVVGVDSAEADAALRQVYAPILAAGTPYVSTDLSTAELVKVSANAFLATKISFINAIADICDAVGADVITLAEAIGLDERIGPSSLAAGLGFGGGCLSKDIRALEFRAEELGVVKSLQFLREIDALNIGRRQRTVDVARALVGGFFPDRHVAVLGVAFKPNTDDVRDSPALSVAVRIKREGATVRVHDPEATGKARELFPDLDYTAEPEQACGGADIVLHLTEWEQYQAIDPVALASVVRQPRLVDARNVLPLDRWRAAGWTVRGLGRAAS